MAVLIIGFIGLSGFLYFYTMKLIYALIHGKDKKMESRLVSDSLGGAVLFALATSLLIGFI